jgi:hypothetical protein
MRLQPNKVRGDRDRCAERAVVLQVLRDDHGARWSRTELEDELADVEVSVIDGALASLCRDGVLHTADGVVWASDAARRLDELELIGV